MTGYPELAVGGVLMAPFVGYAVAALAILLVLRPLLRLVAFDRAFFNPPVANLCLYVLVLAALIVMF
ncbi:DUF1656 domain-containing protein [Lichenibacterium ramalinae]|uniref:DUF1656 domain-containing protein n=1 Tax=Lichenibacterium ramalinae TaxID=2316527 RepID=A0A4Q2REI9_9HYPH|nr:DUF1656 domain-containing protein [Lichenibacterium ramalinae]RYB04609.1 DUF1656 domain-containing protein [Lichenibacterium ramalinae]